MPINGFSVGRDVTLNVITPGGPIPFGLVTKFSSKPVVSEAKVKGLDGVTRHVRFPDGWQGSFDCERQDSTLDDYFAQIEANYYAGLDEKPCTITETITETTGAITQYRYIGVLFKLDDAGEWEGDKTVKQRLSFVAEQRIKVA